MPKFFVRISSNISSTFATAIRLGMKDLEAADRPDIKDKAQGQIWQDFLELPIFMALFPPPSFALT